MVSIVGSCRSPHVSCPSVKHHEMTEPCLAMYFAKRSGFYESGPRVGHGRPYNIESLRKILLDSTFTAHS